MSQFLKLSAASGLAALLLSIPALVMSFTGADFTSTVMFLLADVLFIVHLLGFKKIAEKLKLDFLENTTLGLIGLTVFSMIALFVSEDLLMFHLATLVILGIAIIIFGIAVFDLKKDFKGTATAVGVLSIIVGAGFLTVILAPVALLVDIAASIMSVILLFKASKMKKFQ